MAEELPNLSSSRAQELLTRADDLMSRHRAQQREREARTATAANEGIPTLTDYVPEEAEAAFPDLELPPPLNLSTEPKLDTSETMFAAIAAKEQQSFDDEVFAKLHEQLDRDLGVMLETRLMPELMGALEQAMNHVTAELQEKVRTMVREAIDQALVAKVRNRDFPMPDDNP